MKLMEQIMQLFPLHLRGQLKQSGCFTKEVEEIRVRIHQPLLVCSGGGEQRIPGLEDYRITRADLLQMVSYISKCSIYAFDDEIQKGFLTLQGGHRVGIAGQVILDENGHVRTIRPITYLNIRIAHQVYGCAESLADWLWEAGQLQNTLILSPPGEGKTTMLRDLMRILSDGTNKYAGMKVGIVDERSELGGCQNGIPQNDVGLRTDILDGCPKAAGMLMMVRSMSPQVLAVDEIGTKEDFEAVAYALNCGCAVFATMHCSHMKELPDKPFWHNPRNRHLFSRYVLLERRQNKHGFEVYDRKLERLC